eukprot:UC1_evm2s746
MKRTTERGARRKQKVRKSRVLDEDAAWAALEARAEASARARYSSSSSNNDNGDSTAKAFDPAVMAADAAVVRMARRNKKKQTKHNNDINKKSSKTETKKKIIESNSGQYDTHKLDVAGATSGSGSGSGSGRGSDSGSGSSYNTGSNPGDGNSAKSNDRSATTEGSGVEERVKVRIKEELIKGTVFIRQLPPGTSRLDLESMLSNFGVTTSVRLVFDPATRRPKGTAFADFADVRAARRIAGVSTAVRKATVEKNKKKKGAAKITTPKAKKERVGRGGEEVGEENEEEEEITLSGGQGQGAGAGAAGRNDDTIGKMASKLRVNGKVVIVDIAVSNKGARAIANHNTARVHRGGSGGGGGGGDSGSGTRFEKRRSKGRGKSRGGGGPKRLGKEVRR